MRRRFLLIGLYGGGKPDPANGDGAAGACTAKRDGRY